MLLGGAVITIAGCGGGAASSPTAAAPPAAAAPLTDAQGAISSNHGHVAVVSAAQLGEGGALDLDIRGSASHTHGVSLSATEIATVRAGGRVQRESTGTSHTHTVTFNA